PFCASRASTCRSLPPSSKAPTFRMPIASWKPSTARSPTDRIPVMSTQTFTLPDVGEGLTEAEIVTWKVAPGDTVAINDVICEIETAKSLVELPSPHAGTVGEILVAEGVTVEVGSPIITFVSADAAPAASAPAAPAAEEGGGSVLVGYGTGGGATS